MADGEDQDESSKTEDPSQKKLEEARKRGQVAQSKEMSAWLMLLAATLVMTLSAPGMFSGLQDLFKTYLEQSAQIAYAPGAVGRIMGETFSQVIIFLIVPFALLTVASFFGPFAQVGFVISPEVLKPDFSKISIIKGFARLFSMKAIVEFLKGIVKLVAIGVVAYVLIEPYFGQIEHAINQPLIATLDEMKSLGLRMMVGILVLLFFVAVIDVLYQRWEFTKQMRMTKQEVKDEYKQTEGDPYIKGKLKQLRMEKARQRMMAAVPKADVVITNPTHFAVALKYDDGMDAPQVIAKGVDEVALRIREVAKEHKVEIVENPPLARSLYDLVEIDQSIPQELFKAVAEVISYVYKKQGKLKPRK
jgi:flagellar biosynthesis protein FlhB